MLIKSHQLGIFEKVIRSKNGQLLRVRFEVTEIDGKLKGRVISTEAIAEFAAITGATKKADSSFLPVFVSKDDIFREVFFTDAQIVSPFSTLLFFTSQPTRAPSL